MIFVTLGTQDKSFSRLLEAIDDQIEKGNIKEKVIAQIGYTKYESKNMEIFDLISPEEFNKYISKSRIVITHGGVGSILSAIQKEKIVIAAPRLKKYKEHTNDHQKQIVREFADMGYILELRDFNKLDKVLKKVDSFKPKKYISNNKNFVHMIDQYIEFDNHISWFNKFREMLSYLFFGLLTTLVNIISFYFLDKTSIDVYISNFIAWCLSFLFAFVTNRLFVFKSKNKNFNAVFKEFYSFFFFRVLSLGIDMVLMYFLISVLNFNKLFSKILVNAIVIVLNYIFSKLFIFKDKKD